MEPLIAGPLGKSLNIDIYRGLSHDWGVRRETWRGGTDVICVRFLQMSDMGRRCHAGRRKGNVGTDWNRNLGRMVKGGKKGGRHVAVGVMNPGSPRRMSDVRLEEAAFGLGKEGRDAIAPGPGLRLQRRLCHPLIARVRPAARGHRGMGGGGRGDFGAALSPVVWGSRD